MQIACSTRQEGYARRACAACVRVAVAVAVSVRRDCCCAKGPKNATAVQRARARPNRARAFRNRCATRRDATREAPQYPPDR